MEDKRCIRYHVSAPRSYKPGHWPLHTTDFSQAIISSDHIEFSPYLPSFAISLTVPWKTDQSYSFSAFTANQYLWTFTLCLALVFYLWHFNEYLKTPTMLILFSPLEKYVNHSTEINWQCHTTTIMCDSESKC